MDVGVLRWKALGEYFGFPECCIKEFLETACQSTKDRYPEGPWSGTGFLPCLQCSEKALEFKSFVRDYITPHRVCPTPFPRNGSIARMDIVAERGAAKAPLSSFTPLLQARLRHLAVRRQYAMI